MFCYGVRANHVVDILADFDAKGVVAEAGNRSTNPLSNRDHDLATSAFRSLPAVNRTDCGGASRTDHRDEHVVMR